MKELKAKPKVTQAMTRDGLTLENQATGEVENISSREAEQDYTPEAGGTAEKLLERADDAHERHKAKKSAKQAAATAAEWDAALHRPSSRLQLTEEERADPDLQPYIRKADQKADKLDAARDAIPKKRVVVKETIYDEATGKAKSALRFEQQDKGPPKLKPNPAGRPVSEALLFAHGKIHEVEHENVGVEGGHKGEELAERLAGRAIRSSIRHHKLKPYRAAEKAERQALAANAEYFYQKSLRDNPEIAQAATNPVSRFWQKQQIKRQYAKAARTAGQTAGAAAQGTAKTAAGESKRAASFVARHWKGSLSVLVLGLLLLMVMTGLQSCTAMFGSAGSGIAASSYFSEDSDMLAAEDAYATLEAELQAYLDNYEATHDYDEYHFDLDSIEHDPYVLISILSALHDGQFTIGEVRSDLQMLFDKQYILTETVVVETRYRTETDTWTDAVSSRFSDAAEANTVKAACAGAQAVCASVMREKKTEQSPKLYDLTTLQREANRLFGFTAKQTLDYAQTLYEKKLLTYPRTDSQYLTEDMLPVAESLVSRLWELVPFAKGLNISPQFDRILNSKKVSDHHAIIPTAEFEKQGFDGLAESERKLLSLICCKVLCAVAGPYVYEAVTATFTCAGKEFTAKGKTVLFPGWKELDRRFRFSLKADSDEDAEAVRELPELKEGQTFADVAASVTEHFTTPPKPYTEDTLLSAMERAGAEDMPEDAERKGLGTPATRAAILEKLVQMGFVQRKGKQLIPTKDGINLAVVLPEALTSPQLTAEWESRLTEIAKGQADPDEFMAGIEAMTRELVKTYSCISEDKQKLFQAERVAIGTCPRCGEAVYEGRKNYYCGNRACQFVMWKNDRFFEERRKAFTPKIAAALLKDGKAKVKGLYSMKTGKTYDGTVLLADTGGKYVNYRVEHRS